MGTITVTNLGKAYKQYSTRWSRLAESNGFATFILHEYWGYDVDMSMYTNIGEEELVLIEVQRGGYLGEDDIVRLADTYGRA